ncbi:T9SS type A sorting domain-containing protein [Adhaeribacter swui]|uniref:T9SS type A sorting domain-containing protein n=1 Tax=Adhaeribacter swui TaxID=2086471 RepID=A0A7G7GE36_9BACT|nr:T9SS type A sorting domain-containing protein [Adhaeribacter swui]QNF35420.1 T9SS type A sorting domain-containing protein [Adhaeribacter swui]
MTIPLSAKITEPLIKTKKHWLIILCFLMIVNIGSSTIMFGQTIQWQTGISGNSERPNTMIGTQDGGYLIASLNNSIIQFIKLDKEGKVTLKRSIVSSGSLEAIVATQDGGYLVGGNLKSDYWVMKIDKNWSKVWEKSYGGNSTENLVSLIGNQDGSFLLGGTSYSNKGKSKTQDLKGLSDFWLVKIDGSGAKIWDKSFGGVKTWAIDYVGGEYDGDWSADTILTGNSYLGGIASTPEGGYILGGSTNSFAGGDNTSGDSVNQDFPQWDAWDQWIIKIDNDGKQIWDKTEHTNSYIPPFKSIISTLDGCFLITRTNYDLYDGCGGYQRYNTISKVNGLGINLWESNFNEYTSIFPTKDGGYLVGYSPYFNGKAPADDYNYYDECYQDVSENDFWILKLDANGFEVWKKIIGGNDQEYLTNIFPTYDGNYLLAGFSNSGISGDKTIDFEGTEDFWLVKLKEDNPFAANWNLRYGGWNDENFTTILKTTDGGYLSGGYSNSSYTGDKWSGSQGKNDYWIVKSDKDGKLQWEQTYGGSNDDYLNRVIQTLDGGYLLAGSSLSGLGGDKRQGSRGDRDYWIVKIDSKGNIEWDKRFGGKGYDELKKVIQLSTGEYILAGYSLSPAGGDKSQSSQGGADFWLVKISKTGTKIWDKRYGGSLNDLLSGIVETADGGYLLSGTSLSGKSGDKSQGSRGGSDFWIVRVDKNGKKLWDKTYGGSGQDEAFSSGRNGNDFFIAGQSDSPAGADKTRGSQGGKDFWLLKLTSTGAKVWDKRFGGSKDDELKASILTKDGSYILAGKSFSDKSGNKSQNSQGSSDYWIVKADKDGMYQWDKRFGGSGTEDLRAVTQTADGGLLLAGKSDSGVSGDRTQPSQGGTDFWLVKVAPEIKSIVAAREAVEVEEPAIRTSQVNLIAYPNPFSDKVTITLTLPQAQPATITMYDSQGRKVANLFQGEVQANQESKVEWQAGSNAEGLYILQLQTPTQRHSQKLIILK